MFKSGCRKRVGISALATVLLLAAGVLFAACSSRPASDSGTATAVDPALTAAPPAVPMYRDPGFYGVNTGYYDLLQSNVAWRPETAGLSDNFTLETRVKIIDVSAEDAAAGLALYWDGTAGDWAGSYNFQIYPVQERWKLHDPGKRKYLADQYQPGAFDLDQWHDLKVKVSGGRMQLFIDGVEKSPAGGITVGRGAGISGLRIQNCTALFDHVTFTNDATGQWFDDDFGGGIQDWSEQTPQAWSLATEEGRQYLKGSVLLGADSLAGPDVSPQFQQHFRMLAKAGASTVRIFFHWSDIQAAGPDSYFWDYTDAMVTQAHDNHLSVLAALIMAPPWAIPAANRGDEAADAVPPANDADYARFVDAVVRRYGPGGDLARERGWDDGYGVTFYEIGHEFNAGRVVLGGRTVFAAWLGTLDQYLDLLKAGHDAVKNDCPQCLVLNGGATDDMQPFYPAQTDPTGRRQYLWQAVDDLYTRIQQLHPGDPNAVSQYFDVLNIHVYQWFVNSGAGQDPDSYRSYQFPDARWYQDRLSQVTAVMARHGDSQRPIWITEAAYASADNGDPYRGHVDEPLQAQGLETVYREAAAFPQVQKVFWWYAYDIGTYTGLIRGDLSPKPSYLTYEQLTGNVNR